MSTYMIPYMSPLPAPPKKKKIGPLWKYKKNMWRSVIFNKSTELNASPQVFLSLNKANGLDLWKRPRVLFALKQSNGILLQEHCLLCLIPFLFLEIQIAGVKNFRNKNVSITSPLPCISPPKIVATVHKPWTYRTTRGWLRGWSLFIIAGRFVSPVRILYWKKCKFKVEMCDTRTT